MIKAGVIGWPIEQSKSPIIHQHWLKKYGITGSYEKIGLSPENFESGVMDLEKAGFAGVNVTVPHKIAALELSDEQSERAIAIGAANTLVFKDGKIFADNTDGEGFINNLMAGAPDWNAGSGPALVLGAGGAARAVLHSLLDAGVPEIILANRTEERARELASYFGRKIVVAKWNDIEDIAGAVDTVVNSTSLGMIGQPALGFEGQRLRSEGLVTDLVYNPLETDLLKTGKAKGCATVDGLGMLLHQAVPGFEAWFGARPQVDNELREKVLAEL